MYAQKNRHIKAFHPAVYMPWAKHWPQLIKEQVTGPLLTTSSFLKSAHTGSFRKWWHVLVHLVRRHSCVPFIWSIPQIKGKKQRRKGHSVCLQCSPLLCFYPTKQDLASQKNVSFSFPLWIQSASLQNKIKRKIKLPWLFFLAFLYISNCFYRCCRKNLTGLYF